MTVEYFTICADYVPNRLPYVVVVVLLKFFQHLIIQTRTFLK